MSSALSRPWALLSSVDLNELLQDALQNLQVAIKNAQAAVTVVTEPAHLRALQPGGEAVLQVVLVGAALGRGQKSPGSSLPTARDESAPRRGRSGDPQKLAPPQ